MRRKQKSQGGARRKTSPDVKRADEIDLEDVEFEIMERAIRMESESYPLEVIERQIKAQEDQSLEKAGRKSGRRSKN